MRIPKQFYFQIKEPGKKKNDEDDDNYFEFNAGEGGKGNSIKKNGAKRTMGGHPLVPPLDLPRPDPNDQWRELMAQAQSYEDAYSSSQVNSGQSSLSSHLQSSSQGEESEEEESSYEDSESES